MVGNEKIIKELNKNLKAELTAIMQYMVESEVCYGWGYKSLGDLLKKRAVDEMKHAEALIERIVFLEGIPVVGELNAVNIGKTIEEMHANDHAAEIVAIDGYEKSISIAFTLKDSGTRELFEKHLREEEAHIDIIESNQTQIAQMGIGNYLVEQLG